MTVSLPSTQNACTSSTVAAGGFGGGAACGAWDVWATKFRQKNITPAGAGTHVHEKPSFPRRRESREDDTGFPRE